MLQIYKLLKRAWFIDALDIIDIQQKSDWYYFKCKAILKDHSELWIEETYESTVLLYSYHWQDKSNKLIKRWDNAPHHKEIVTYPHHIHSPEIEPSYNPDIAFILKEIEKVVKTNITSNETDK